jgi:hypothetical protein
MRFGDFVFGSVRIYKKTYDHDLVIEGGKIRKRKKKPSKKFRKEFGHTPLPIEEKIPREVPAACDWDWCIWPVTGDARSKGRGRTPPHRVAHRAPSSFLRTTLYLGFG